MRPFILYSKMSHVTGQALCDALGWEGGTKLSKLDDITHLIRWGTTLNADLDAAMKAKHRPVYNRAVNINAMVNRHHMMQSITSIIGNRCIGFHAAIPPTITQPEEWVLRHRFGRWGKDIVLPETVQGRFNPGAWDGYFMTRRWLADFEVRVHVMNDSSIFFQIKGRRGPDNEPVIEIDPNNINKFIIRNDRNGWHLWPLSNEDAKALGINKDAIRKLSKSLTTACGLSFGCVDFLVRVPKGPWATFDYRCIEINTAPGLANSTLDAYVQGFKSLVNTVPISGDEEPDFDGPEDEDADAEEWDDNLMEDAQQIDFAPDARVEPHPLPPAPRVQERAGPPLGHYTFVPATPRQGTLFWNEDRGVQPPPVTLGDLDILYRQAAGIARRPRR